MGAVNGERSHAQTIVVAIIAGSVGLSLIIFTAAAAWTLVNRDLTLSNAQTAFLSTIFGAMVGILGSYLGYQRGMQAQNGAQAAAEPVQPATAAGTQAKTEQTELAALGPSQKG